MSRFCGKCDFYDFVSDRDPSTIQLYVNNTKMDASSEKALALWYPHIVGAASGNKDMFILRLSKIPFIDLEEKESLNFKLDMVKKYYRKCKRNKIEYTVDGVINNPEFSFFADRITLKELASRVLADGEKATVKNMHLSLHNHYREKWYEELIRLGYDTGFADYWVYHRFDYVDKF